MKKLFVLFLLFVPMFVSASSITKLEVLNGVLSPYFDSNNNIYSVILNADENELKLNYELQDENATVSFFGQTYTDELENIATLSIVNSDGTKEIYTFYLEKEENVAAVFHEYDSFVSSSVVSEIPHLKFYVSGGCILIILLLFKIIVLGFHKNKKDS